MKRSQRVLEISKEWLNDTFVSKNADYGDSYVLTGETIRLWIPEGIVLDTPLKHIYIGLLTRMLDKLIRTSNLVFRGKPEQVRDEKAYMTMGDLGVYGFMACEVLKNSFEQPDDEDDLEELEEIIKPTKSTKSSKSSKRK
jgi:hypothetical protein